MKLVPFGEAIPFETVIPFLKEVDFGEADFWPGGERVVFQHPRGNFAVLICYESTFPRLARRFVADGAELLVNITNDVWYGKTSMPFQHASMAVMRAVENRRSLARSANSGVSMLVDPYGRVLARTEIFEEGFLVENLPVVSGKTPYTRVRGRSPVGGRGRGWTHACARRVRSGRQSGRAAGTTGLSLSLAASNHRTLARYASSGSSVRGRVRAIRGRRQAPLKDASRISANLLSLGDLGGRQPPLRGMELAFRRIELPRIGDSRGNALWM